MSDPPAHQITMVTSGMFMDISYQFRHFAFPQLFVFRDSHGHYTLHHLFPNKGRRTMLIKS